MLKKQCKKFVWILISMLLLTILYFYIPFSPLKSDFNKEVSLLQSNSTELTQFFTAEDIKALPVPVKKYFEKCGYIGTPKMKYMKATHKNVDFLLSLDKPSLKIDYTQYTFAKEPARLAFINTSLYGIPFQGLDSYVHGIGRMKGVFAKTFTLFDQTGTEMNLSNLVNVLSECLLVPSIALQDYITWESIDDTHAKAVISYYGLSASGNFTFSENGEMLSFKTNDRWAVGTDGSKIQVPWSILLSDYKDKNGIKQPTSFKAVWHYESGDSIYFDSKNPIIDYQ